METRGGQPDLTLLAAASLVESYGDAALQLLKDRAELAEALGHEFAARTWRRLLVTATRLVEVEQAGAIGPGTSVARQAANVISEFRC